MAYTPSTFGTMPTPPVRRHGEKFSTKVIFQDAPLFTTHSRNIEPYPFLPGVRRLGAGSMDVNQWNDAVVIEQGEPVGIYRDPVSGRQYLVPCTGPSNCTITYSSQDVEWGIENIDAPGSPVTAAGTSTALIPKVLPLGVALHPVLRNFSYSTGTRNFPDVYQNYSPDLKPTIANFLTMEVPFYRGNHPLALSDPESGEKLVVRDITTISATSRPWFQTANIVSTAAGDATAATSAITISPGGPSAGDTLVIYHMGNTYTLTAVAANANTAIGEFVTSATETIVAANIKATLDVVLNPGELTASVSGNIVTLTSVVLGTVGNIVVNTSDMDNTDAISTDANETVGVGAELSQNAASATNLSYVVGHIYQVIGSLAEDGGVPTLAHTVTTPGLGLAGRETGGVPTNLYAPGNSPSGGSVYPTDYREAGAIRIRIQVL